MGNVAMWGEQFRGQATVYAVLQDLLTRQNLASGAQLLFGGCSAGARGAMVHLDGVAAYLQAYGVQVRGLLDSSLWVDVTPAQNKGTAANMGDSLLDQAQARAQGAESRSICGLDCGTEEGPPGVQAVYGFANTTAIISEACAAAYPSAQYKCMFGQYRMPFLQTPYFLVQSQARQHKFHCPCAQLSARCSSLDRLP